MKRGVSTYISVLLLVVIAVAGGILIYSYYMGFFGDIQTPDEPAVLSIDSAVCNAEAMVIYLRNSGSGTGAINRIYIDDIPMDEDRCTLIIGDLDADNMIQSGGTVSITVLPNAGFQTEHIYEVSIVTTTGENLIQTIRSTVRSVYTTYTKQTCYWPIDGSDGSTVSDPPNPTYVGTITGSSIVDGVAGDAISFDGLYDALYVADGDDLDLTSTGTLEAWVNAETHKTYAGIIHKGELADFSDESYSLQFWNSDGTIRLGIFDPGDYLVVDSVTKLNTGEWYHVVGTWNSTDLAIYINGELDNRISNTMGSASVSDGGLVIGAQLTEDYNTAYKRFGFQGIIDEPAVYKECLSQSEIKARYEALTP